jgi:hypothetical protein
MFRNVKISFRITLLVMLMTLVATAAVSVIALRAGHDAKVSDFVYAGLVICAFAVAMTMVYARSLMDPLESLDATLRMVSRGELPEKSDEQYPGELGRMQSRLDDLVKVLQHSASFAQQVGEGKFETTFNPASENDTLGHALLDMRDNLVANDLREKERNWIFMRLAEAGEILRTKDTLEGLGEDIIRFVIGKTGAIQGAFYVFNEESKTIELTNSFAYNRKKYLKKSFRVAEGLVGQAVAEKDIIIRTEIPDDYVTISSGLLGDRKPKFLVIMPLIANEEVYGALELAGLDRFYERKINLIKELGVILGTGSTKERST